MASSQKQGKITVIGAGNVGATAAENIARKDIVGEVVLIDIVEGMPQGKALDMAQAGPIHLYDTKITGTNNYEDTAGSDICIITAGLPRKPGMSRDDLLAKNADIVRSVTEQFVRHSPDSILIVVSNPLDVMTYVSYMASGFPSQRVMGMAGVLDTARYRAFIRMELGCSVRDIQAMLMGGHGDTMVPLPRYTTVAGVPLTQLLSKERINEIVERTKFGGGEIVKLMGTSAWYAPGAASAEMAEAIIRDTGRIVPAAVWLTGQWGLKDIFVGAPVRLGRNGIEEIIEVELDGDERKLLENSAEAVRELVEAVERIQANA
jgi:malate dehydrogenase